MRYLNPSLLIMAKTVGFEYLASTQILKVDGAGQQTTSSVDDDVAEAAGEPPPREADLLNILNELVPTKKPRTKLTDTQRPFAYHEGGLENLEIVWQHITQNEVAKYKDWYRQANADCRALAADLRAEIAILKPPDPVRMVIGVVAATSQGTLWEDNIQLAREVIESRDVSKFQVKKKKTDVDSAVGDNLKITKDNLAKVQRILSGDFSALQTDKFGAFFASIENPDLTANTVVVDTHAAGMWLGRRVGAQDDLIAKNRPEGARLSAMVRDYRKLAQKVGYTPQSVQAVTWSVWRQLPPQYETEFMRSSETKPEVEMFKALYPFLYAASPGKKKATWRWRYSRFNDLMRPDDMPKDEWDFVKNDYKHLMPHHTPDEFRLAVEKYGHDLDQYYGFPANAWNAFLRAYPDFGLGLDRTKQSTQASLAGAVSETRASTKRFVVQKDWTDEQSWIPEVVSTTEDPSDYGSTWAYVEAADELDAMVIFVEAVDAVQPKHGQALTWEDAFTEDPAVWPREEKVKFLSDKAKRTSQAPYGHERMSPRDHQIMMHDQKRMLGTASLLVGLANRLAARIATT